MLRSVQRARCLARAPWTYPRRRAQAPGQRRRRLTNASTSRKAYAPWRCGWGCAGSFGRRSSANASKMDGCPRSALPALASPPRKRRREPTEFAAPTVRCAQERPATTFRLRRGTPALLRTASGGSFPSWWCACPRATGRSACPARWRGAGTRSEPCRPRYGHSFVFRFVAEYWAVSFERASARSAAALISAALNGRASRRGLYFAGGHRSFGSLFGMSLCDLPTLDRGCIAEPRWRQYWSAKFIENLWYGLKNFYQLPNPTLRRTANFCWPTSRISECGSSLRHAYPQLR